MKASVLVIAGLVSLTAASVLSGCGGTGGAENSATVEGTVTFEQQPVAAGEVHLYNPQRGIGPSATIADGKFRFPLAIPPGSYEVSIVPPQPEGPPDPEAAMPEYPSIPPQYRSASTSGLVAEIQEGENTLTYDLTP